MPRKKLSDVSGQVQGMGFQRPSKEEKWTKDRTWEEKQRNRPAVTQVSYRGIPRKLNDKMKAIAKQHNLNVSQVAGAFLAYALAEHTKGTSIQAMRQTESELFPGAGNKANSAVPLAGKIHDETT
jgi:hypothetical protein